MKKVLCFILCSVVIFSLVACTIQDAEKGAKNNSQTESADNQYHLELYCYNQQFFLRGGYHYEDAYKGNRKYFTLGAGFRMSVFSLDAAYLISTAQSNPLDQTLRFSLSFDMDGLKDLFRR